MSEKNENGHASNVASFEQIISVCEGFGTFYNPSKNSIKLAALNTVLTNTNTCSADVKAKFNEYSVAVDVREILFENFTSLLTRIINTVVSSDVTLQKINDAKAIIRKLRGERKSKKIKTGNESPPAAENENIAETPKTISVSQLSYTSKIDNFALLIDLLAGETGYNPNESDLKVSSLNTLITSMRDSNTAIYNAQTALTNARIARNEVMYNKQTGLTSVASEVKAYVKAVFGARSEKYKMLSGIKFRNLK